MKKISSNFSFFLKNIFPYFCLFCLSVFFIYAYIQRITLFLYLLGFMIFYIGAVTLIFVSKVYLNVYINLQEGIIVAYNSNPNKRKVYKLEQLRRTTKWLFSFVLLQFEGRNYIFFIPKSYSFFEEDRESMEDVLRSIAWNNRRDKISI